MNTSQPTHVGQPTHGGHPKASASRPVRQGSAASRRVVDAPIRMFHWLFALCFAGAYLTADGERLRLLHVTLGCTMAGLLVFRVAYGLLGPRTARLSILRRKLAGFLDLIRSPSAGGAAGGDRPASRNGRTWLNLAMAGAVFALLALVIPLLLSGYAAYHEWGGKWLEELHEAAGEAYPWAVLAHLGLILALSAVRRRNQALPMLTGRVEGAGPDLVRRNHGPLAWVLLVAVLTYWAWEWLAWIGS